MKNIVKVPFMVTISIEIQLNQLRVKGILILGIQSGIVTETIRDVTHFTNILLKITSIFPNKPTHYPINKMIPTIIDIGFAKNVTSLLDLTVLQELNSYHYPVFFTTGVTTRNNMTLQMNDYATAD
ncbi:hypothetical protein HZH68_011724 [Vespula germanica]|uniref:Uncharacterized protein n=1 Tax=Vespula germanica TaxID=30212 RepID=A0A834MYK1_VESGE|nr:hypothetical protein HZH68_011724 [Vespula germanica]